MAFLNTVEEELNVLGDATWSLPEGGMVTLWLVTYSNTSSTTSTTE